MKLNNKRHHTGADQKLTRPIFQAEKENQGDYGEYVHMLLHSQPFLLKFQQLPQPCMLLDQQVQQTLMDLSSLNWSNPF